jgi:hypothetical protein
MLALCAFFPMPAQASTVDNLFEKIAGLLVKVGVDPDQIEMARFTIKYPREAAEVYEHAGAQDYPYFTLIGVAKAARHKNLLTYEQCKLPFTSVDVLFGKADTLIDEGAQQGGGNDAFSGYAKAYATNVAKQGTDSAKQQAKEELAKAIPYWSDIPTICTAAYQTDLAQEKKIIAMVNKTSATIVKAYNALKSGDVVTGADMLISLGADSAFVCDLIDSAVSGGFIGRTPILGKLAKGACVGFAGKVFAGASGIVKGGVGLAEDGVSYVYDGAGNLACSVYSYFGNGCSKGPPPPDYGSQVVTAVAQWCAPYGGTDSLAIGDGKLRREAVTNTGPTEGQATPGSPYRFVCKDGSGCVVKAANLRQCSIQADLNAYIAQQKKINHPDFVARLTQWKADYDKRWQGQCPPSDAQCAIKVNFVGIDTFTQANGLHNQYPLGGFVALTFPIISGVESKASKLVNQSRFDTLPGIWKQAFDSRWNAKCLDDQCRAAIKSLSDGTLLLIKTRQASGKPYSSVGLLYVNAEYEAMNRVVTSDMRVHPEKYQSQNPLDLWMRDIVSFWQAKCADALCRTEVAALGTRMETAARTRMIQEPTAPLLSIQSQVGKEFSPKYEAAVIASKVRTSGAPTGPIKLNLPKQS